MPIITANWNADSDERWTVPIGAGIGKIVRFGRSGEHAAGGVLKRGAPDDGPIWQLRAEVQFMFPK